MGAHREFDDDAERLRGADLPRGEPAQAPQPPVNLAAAVGNRAFAGAVKADQPMLQRFWFGGPWAGATTEATPDEATLQTRANAYFAVVQAAWTDAATHAQAWLDAADQVGQCYVNAWERHKDAVEKDAVAEQLGWDVAVGVLSIMVGGALGSVVTAAQSRTVTMFHLKDWEYAGITGVIAGAIGKTVDVGKPEAEASPIGASPHAFHLDLTKAVNGHTRTALQHLNRYVQHAKDVQTGKLPLSLLSDFDPEQFDASMQAYKEGKALFRAPADVPAEELERELETGLWAEWVQQLRVVREFLWWEWEHEYEIPGPQSLSRLLTLGVPIYSLGRVGGWPAVDADDVGKLMAWGKRWTPSKTFGIG